MTETVLQLFIFGMTACALFLLSCKDNALKYYGGVVGLGAQPFWLLDTYAHGQWGMFGLTIIMMYLYYRVMKNHG